MVCSEEFLFTPEETRTPHSEAEFMSSSQVELQEWRGAVGYLGQPVVWDADTLLWGGPDTVCCTGQDFVFVFFMKFRTSGIRIKRLELLQNTNINSILHIKVSNLLNCVIPFYKTVFFFIDTPPKIRF